MTLALEIRRQQRADRPDGRPGARAALPVVRRPDVVGFDAFGITAIGLSVLAVALAALDGESSRLEGLQLLGIYVVLGLAFYIIPG